LKKKEKVNSLILKTANKKEQFQVFVLDKKAKKNKIAKYE